MKVAMSPSLREITEGETMARIIVTADHGSEEAVMLCERVNVTDFESDHFARQLVERLGWAVSDAHHAENENAEDEARARARDDVAGYPPASVVTTAS
jgi:ABC-type nitrate/sulfonate/bicarbonate transport system ATPase subunit